MLPKDLTPASFAAYPPEARQLATQQIALLQRLPLVFLPLLLRELIVYDWKFPSERTELDRQFTWLNHLPPAEFTMAMSDFASLKLTPSLEKTAWVGNPAIFSEQLSAHLWSTHQIDRFRAAAVDYVQKSSTTDAALPTHRLGIAVIGQGSDHAAGPLFRKLRPHGTYFSQVKPASIQTLLDAVATRAKAHPAPYAHWYIDGGAGLTTNPGITLVSYGALSPLRATLQSLMQKAYEAPVFDPEAFRTMLAQIKPEDAGLSSNGDRILNRFQLSLLTEGSGTQVFATTFVQWAAREALRRAQPLTLLTRFAPRQREKQMNELLAERQHTPDLDPQGSLVDADRGAYYNWLNQQRLPGEKQSAFLAWFEDHKEAVAIAPAFERGTQSDAPIHLAQLIEQLA
jgi:hypothetical protein